MTNETLKQVNETIRPQMDALMANVFHAGRESLRREIADFAANVEKARGPLCSENGILGMSNREIAKAQRARPTASTDPSPKPKRRNPWAHYTPEQRAERVRKLLAGRGLKPKKK